MTALESDLFSNILDSYQQEHYRRGYADGYQRATAEALTKALENIEAFVRQEASRTAVDPRQLLYRFNRYLESRILDADREPVFVSDGLGI